MSATRWLDPANLFNPRVIVIGGYFASLAQWLLPHAQDQLQRLVVAAPAAQCRFVASTLGFGAASRGAASMVINHIIDDPTAIMDLPGRHLTDGPTDLETAPSSNRNIRYHQVAISAAARAVPDIPPVRKGFSCHHVIERGPGCSTQPCQKTRDDARDVAPRPRWP